MVDLWLKIMKNEQRKREQLDPNYESNVCHKMIKVCKCKSAGFFSIKKQQFTGLLRVYKVTLLIGWIKEDFSFQKQQ